MFNVSLITRAMLCIAAVFAVVRPSHAGIASKRLNLSYNSFIHQVAPPPHYSYSLHLAAVPTSTLTASVSFPYNF